MTHSLKSPIRTFVALLLVLAGAFLSTGCHTTERVVDGTERAGIKAVHGTGHVIHRTGEGMERVGRGVEHSVE